MTDYCTLAELKTRANITDTNDDVELAKAITVASRRIEKDCGRKFTQDASVVDRFYDISHAYKVVTDDISTLTGLLVYQGYQNAYTLVDSTTYKLRPENALADGESPYILQRTAPYCWYVGWQLKVTAKFGWATVPDPIHEACLLLAYRLFQRKDSPEGHMKGFGALGSVRVNNYDPDYDALIEPYVRREI